MSAKSDNIISRLQQVLSMAGRSKTYAYDTTAEVVRVQDGTAWVHIPGGVDETPVRLTINAKAGDQVQVRVSGGRAFLVGNGTAPPTDNTVANEAFTFAGLVNQVAIRAGQVADRAFKIAGDTAQYFWVTEEGTDTGAHITEIPQEEFLDDPDNGGANLLLRSIGVAVRYGLAELASFSANGISIGTDDKTKISLDTTNGLKLGNKIQLDTSGNASFNGEITSSSAYISGGSLNISSDASSVFSVRAANPSDSSKYAYINLNTYGDSGTRKIHIANYLSSNKMRTLDINTGGILLRNNELPSGSGVWDVTAGIDIYDTSILIEAENGVTCNGTIKASSVNGNIGNVITTNPSANHQVSHFYMSSASTLQVSAQGNSSSFATYNISASSSDIRLKKNVEDCQVDALDVINRIKVREFDWLYTGGHQKIGVVADELEKIDPRLTVGGGVEKDGSMNVKSVDTFYLLGYLVKAVQELSARVEELEKK